MNFAHRRRFLIASGALVTFAAHGQAPAKLPRIGMLSASAVSTGGHLMQAFVRGLAELGYMDGKNVLLEMRYGDGRPDLLPALVKDLADRKVDLLFAPSALAAGAAKKAGFAAPIVFAFIPDPLSDGFVATLARPGGNMTGLTSQSTDVAAKRVELLREAFPRASRVAVMYALPFPGVSLELQETERAARLYGAELLRTQARRPDDFETVFGEIAQWKADALVVIENPMFFANRQTIARLAEKRGLPAIYKVREYVAAGGLMSYGSDYADLARRAAAYVDKILKGAKPSELPVEQPVKFELVVNLTTAKTMGLTIPRGFLLRANELIE